VKILVVSNLYPPDVMGGYEMGCQQVTDALRARGHHVDVLTSVAGHNVVPEPHVHRRLHLTEIYDAERMAASSALTRLLCEADSYFVNPGNVFALTSRIEEFGPDVVYLWNLIGVGGLGLVGAVHHLGLPWVWHLMDAVPGYLCSFRGRPIDAVVREFGRQLHGRFLACSQRVVDEIESKGVPLPGRVDLVPNWVRGPFPALRRRWYDGGHLRIVTAGQVGEHKGSHILIEAAHLLRQRGHTNFSVDVYGSVQDASFQALINRLGLRDTVSLRGFQPVAELVERYRDHDVFAFPTWAREPNAFAPIEAGIAGCVPVISSDCGNAEWLVDGVHCLKAERTPQAFADRLEEVIKGVVDLAPIGRRLRSLLEDFKIEALLPQIEGALADEARRRGRSSGTVEDVHLMAGLAETLIHLSIEENFASG
jgi:glycosyltransferase involved in cell wall biosynthesis